MNVLNESFAILDYMWDIRNYFHSNPELGLEEYKTADRIEKELNSLGIQTQRVGKTGILGTIDTGRPGKTLFMRADIDALPIQEENDVPYKSQIDGKMHACGHDGHGAALLGVAKLLLKHLDELNGKILLAFQPAEEIGKGARTFIEEGLLDRVDRVYGIHFSSGLPLGSYGIKTGECMASCDRFKITIHGKAAHITTPQSGVDATFIASLIVNQLHQITTKFVAPAENALIGIGSFHSGTTYNIISDEAILEGTVRAFSPGNRKTINEKITQIAHSTAQIYGATADVFIDDIADPCINDKESAQEHIAAARKIVAEDKIITTIDKRFGADNFADFMRKAPGCYTFVGSSDGPASSAPHHNGHFDLAKESLAYAAALGLQYALDFCK